MAMPVSEFMRQLEISKINKKLLEKLRKLPKKKLSSKEYNFHKLLYELWDYTIEDCSGILRSFDSQEVNRFRLKTLLESFMNLQNLIKYKGDYANLLRIIYLQEDIDAFRYKEGYKKLGIKIKDTPEKLIKLREKLYADINNTLLTESIRIDSYKEEQKYSCSINKRMQIFIDFFKNIDEEMAVVYFALYDIANNFNHLNLRFLDEIDVIDEISLGLEVQKIVEEMVIISTKQILKEFKLENRLGKFLTQSKKV